MPQTSPLVELIRRARRRRLSNLLLAQVVEAACLAEGGFILLLVAGSQALDWRWLGLLLGTGAAFSATRLRRRIPAPYSVAQEIDRRLELHDTVSTAFFFGETGGRKVSEDVVRAQRAQAEALAARIGPAEAAPYAAPRSLYAMAALGLFATGLFGVRYGIRHSLDLRPPLVSLVFDAFRPPSAEQARRKKDPKDNRFDDLLKQMGLSLDSEGEKVAADQQAAVTGTVSGDKLPKGVTPLSIPSKEQADRSTGQSEDGDSDDSSGSSTPLSPPNRSGADQKSAANRQSSETPENNSLLDKFRDAMNNLLSRLKTQPKGDDARQTASAQQGRAEAGQQKKGAGPRGDLSEGKQRGEGAGKEEGQGKEEGEGAPKGDRGPGKRSGGDTEQQAAKEGKSGIGKEDGAKELRAAEQLAAMGKISEILGKRSQELTGEMMVEVNAGKQQALRTEYSRQEASHAEAGGEIHRDEIPLALQNYVRQYFEQVHKPGPAPRNRDTSGGK